MAECLLPSGNNAMPIKIINFFINKGLTPNQALGICANVFGESSYKTTPTNGESGAYGLFQWTGDRKKKLKEFCTKNGLTESTADAQLAFAWAENDRNVWQKYASNRGMTAMQSLDYWEDNWERCFNNTGSGQGCKVSKEKCCRHSARVTELNRLIDMYKNSVKSSNCSVNVGDGGSSEISYGCDPTSAAYGDGVGDGGDGSSVTTETQKYYSDDHPYEPLGKGVSNTKPVFFGGTWAHYMSHYIAANNDFFTYTVTDGLLDSTHLDGKQRWVTMGGQKDYIHSSTVSTNMLQHIQNYLSMKGNNPKYVVVYVDMTSVITFPSSPKTKQELLDQLTHRLTNFFRGIHCMKVIIPLLVNSWQNEWKYKGITFDYRDFNNCVAKAARCAGSNYITVKITDGDEPNEYTYKGTKKVTILPTWGFEKLSNTIKNYCKKYS